MSDWRDRITIDPGKMSGNWEMDNWRAVERWSLSA